MAKLTGQQLLDRKSYAKMGREDARSGYSRFNFNGSTASGLIEAYNNGYDAGYRVIKERETNLAAELALSWATLELQPSG